VNSIVGHLLNGGNGVTEPILLRAFEYWRNVDKDLGDRVELGVRAKQSERDPKAAEQANPARSAAQARPNLSKFEGPATLGVAGPSSNRESRRRVDGMGITVVGIGGSMREDSQSERALGVVLHSARLAGAETVAITGPELVLPFYDPTVRERSRAAHRLVEALQAADGVVLVSPGYHGTVSGLVKNALDYVEDLRTDARPYLDGRAVGCVAIALGWQAAVTTLTALRSIVHALRGWPTPLGAALNSAEMSFDDRGVSSDPRVEHTLRTIGEQVVEFAQAHASRIVP
jgi:FMN reductase